MWASDHLLGARVAPEGEEGGVDPRHLPVEVGQHDPIDGRVDGVILDKELPALVLKGRGQRPTELLLVLENLRLPGFYESLEERPCECVDVME